MMEVGIFAAKLGLVLAGLIILIVVIALAVAKSSQRTSIEVEPIHDKFKEVENFLKSLTANKSELKALKKESKKESAKKDLNPEKKVFVINFEGDTKASQVDSLREEITAILYTATPHDEVVVKVESPGGVVHGYGLAASELHRLRERNIPLTVCVDKVAASGGYLMACVANKIIAAPFAIIGSIGVVAAVPNFNKILKRHDVEYKEYTAGEYKRTVSVFGEITHKGEEKFLEQLEETHVLFKDFVQENRPNLDVKKVATGEYWFGKKALELSLIDTIQTSDDYLFNHYKNKAEIFEVKYEIKKSLGEKVSEMISLSFEKSALKIWQYLESKKLT